ncbi:MAG: argininosuccinate lyase [Coriobacteriales bacterium]
MAEQSNEHGSDALWGGRFEDSPSDFTQIFGASLPVDQRMWEADIAGSKAHSAMLGRQGIIPQEDVEAIHRGLDEIARQIEEGEFEFDINDEDIHMSIERNLTEAIGPAGGRLHTGRSRNDQVATDTHLHCKQLSQGLMYLVLDLRRALYEAAVDNFGVVMPGYTHMQRAQPVLFSHHMLAYYWMFTRDFDRLKAAMDACDVLPLGSAALAGTTYPLDRFYVAEQLGFGAVYPNSMDAVSDRDFLLDLSYACSVAMMHLSRLSEELIYWSSGEFGFIRLSDAYSTGSSIMPQKKNPDFAELIRGKVGRVYGDLIQLLTTLKGLPLSYNKDMQEDKEGVFDAVDTLSDSLIVMAGMIRTMTVNEDAMRAGAHGGFMAATDLADYLVGKGMPFRDAHAVVGHLVLECEKAGKTLQELSAAELAAASELFGEDAVKAVDIDEVVSKRTTYGGTGHEAVKVQLQEAAERLRADAARL